MSGLKKSDPPSNLLDVPAQERELFADFVKGPGRCEKRSGAIVSSGLRLLSSNKKRGRQKERGGEEDKQMNTCSGPQ